LNFLSSGVEGQLPEKDGWLWLAWRSFSRATFGRVLRKFPNAQRSTAAIDAAQFAAGAIRFFFTHKGDEGETAQATGLPVSG